jgi:DNA-binding transcriptional LysR family regulator
MRLELQQLRQVVALAEHGSFVRAAAALHTSQPALSRSILALEQHAGSPLFVRRASGVEPTDLGLLYIDRGRDLLRLAEDLEREAGGRAALQTGRVGVGGGPYPSEAVLAPAAASLAGRHPGISVHVVTGSWDELVRRLRAREVDFFVAETSTLTQEADLEIEPMTTRHSIHLLGRADHPLAARAPVSTAEVLAYPFVTPSRLPPRVLEPLIAVQRSITRGKEASRAFPAVQTNSLATVKRLIAESDAVTGSILSCVRAELESGQFRLLGTEPWLFLQYGVVSLKSRPWTRAARVMHELALEAERRMSEEEVRLAARHAPRPRRSPGSAGRGPARPRRSRA